MFIRQRIAATRLKRDNNQFKCAEFCFKQPLRVAKADEMVYFCAVDHNPATIIEQLT